MRHLFIFTSRLFSVTNGFEKDRLRDFRRNRSNAHGASGLNCATNSVARDQHLVRLRRGRDSSRIEQVTLRNIKCEGRMDGQTEGLKII
ncbi:hypothetical protein PUN28_006995 [Cardiocondyla obscurior]|uniref:Secreted protein n=1 Tax=Cardiocondyla obscurior TaxID=286306 RepID=A0AAW2G3V7_9HYME